MKNKTIDCIKMKQDVQNRIHREIKNLSRTQQLAYFRAFVSGESALAQKFRRLRPASTESDAQTPASREG